LRDAAADLGLTVDAVRKRVKRGTLESEKDSDGRVYVFLDDVPDTDHPRSDTDRLISTLEEQLRLEREAHAEARRLLAAALERIPAIEPLGKPGTGSEPVPDTPAPPEPETPRVVASSVSHSRLGMSAWALAVSAIATPLTWVFVIRNGGVSDFLLGLLFLFPLLPGLWAGSTKRPSLPWFSSPHRWLRRGGRSILETAVFAAGIPSGVGLAAANLPVPLSPQRFFAPGVLAFPSLIVFATASLAFMSGAFLGNALRRGGLLGTPKEPPQGEEEGDQEEVWSAKKEAQWGLAGSVIVALISALASVVAATLSQ
jgi:hypothetical protein